MPADKIRICELFHSVQGEGLLTGVPSVFVRTSGCPLRCAWCDSIFSSINATTYEEWEPEKLAEKVLEYNCRYVVKTGGEPMMVARKPSQTFLRLLQDKGSHITVETSGVIYRDDLIEFIDLWSICPKFGSAGEGTSWAKVWYDLDILRKYIEHPNRKDIQLKFVVQDDRDLDIIENEFIGKLPIIEKQIPIILNPQGLTESLREYAKRASWLVDAVIKTERYDRLWNKVNLRCLMQNHRIMWNNERLR